MSQDQSTSEDLEGRRLRSALSARLFGTRRTPVYVGKYVLGEPVGEGAMGTVYRAYDPDLDRRVALKLVRQDARHGPDLGPRLVREARALARLGHPNVVAIHDAGVCEHSPYLVMELVEGVDLAAWCERHAAGRGRALQLLAFLEAVAEGLWQAHQKGLVHRDIKPANILVGDDGRPRLGDFGLAAIEGALPTGGEAKSEGVIDQTEPGAAVRLEDTLTQTGAMMGTPAYMAPEQWRGHADARSDQFSLCATFYEALYGVRPFAGSTLPELGEQIRGGQIQAPRRRAARWARRVLCRGLSPDPQQRHGSVGELLAALRAARRRRLLVPGAAIVALGAIVGPQAFPEAEEPCAEVPAVVVSAWDEATRERVQQGFMATEAEFAAATWERVDERMTQLDAQLSERWVAACEAAGADAPGPEAMCMEKVAHTVRFAGERLAQVDIKGLSRAVSTVTMLGRLTRCSRMVDDPQAWTEGDAFAHLERLEKGRVSFRLGDYHGAADRYARLLADTEDGALPGLRASAHSNLWDHFVSSDPLRAFEHAEASLDEATRAHDPDLMADAWIKMAKTPDRPPEFFEFCMDRVAALGERRELSPWIQVRAAKAHAEHLAEQGNDEQAQAWFERSIALHGDPPERPVAKAMTRAAYAESLAFSGHRDEAEAQARKGLATLDEVLGPAHPAGAVVQVRLGNILLVGGQPEAALEFFDAGIERLSKTPEIWPRLLAQAYSFRAAVHHQLGRYEEALADARLAIERSAEAFGVGHSEHLLARNRLAEVLREAGRYEEAIAVVEQTLADYPSQLEADADAHAGVLTLLGECLVEIGRGAEAVERMERAVELRSTVAAEGTPVLLQQQQTAGRVISRAGVHARARASLEEAIEHARRARAPYWEGRLQAELGWAHLRAGEPHAALQAVEVARGLLRDDPGSAARVELDSLETDARASIEGRSAPSDDGPRGTSDDDE